MADRRTAFLLLVSTALAQSLYLGGDDVRAHSDRVQAAPEPKKRPFCNAFTGCGRKRSQLPPLPELQGNSMDVEESLGTLLDLSSEPAVEDLSRQIMSEAKLWEAIQEANMEIIRQRQLAAQQNTVPEEGQHGQQGHQLKCALPSCIAI